MPAGLSVAIALLVQASTAPAYGPPAPAPSATKPAAKKVEESCATAPHKPDQIVVCAQKPQGYRLNPDVIEAKREMRTGRLKRPERFTRNDCGTIGPMGCRFGGIDLMSAAVTALTMVDKAARGENVGKMFVTDPQPDEYHLYLQAKRAREAREIEAAKTQDAAATPDGGRTP
jgi:hypothetical protein